MITDITKSLSLRNTTTMSAEVSQPTTSVLWIQLCIIPIPPIVACYLFAKAAGWVRGYRRLRPVSKDDGLVAEEQSAVDEQLDEGKEVDEEIEGEYDSMAKGCKNVERVRWQIESNHDLPGLRTEEELVEPRRLRSNVKDKVVRGNKGTDGSFEGTSPEQERASGDRQGGIGIRGGVGSDSQGMKNGGWWFDSRWD